VLTPRQEVFQSLPLVERTWAAIRSTDREFNLSTEGPDHLAVGDPDRLEQVVWALLDNAVKYSPGESPISVVVRGVSDERGARSQITVADAGPGMDASTLRHAFEQFFRSEQARRLAPDGSGIGLYAARGLVEAMGGRIDVSSSLGHGTTFTVELPAELTEEPLPVR
jgi:signal transduction histidine kinase